MVDFPTCEDTTTKSTAQPGAPTGWLFSEESPHHLIDFSILSQTKSAQFIHLLRFGTIAESVYTYMLVVFNDQN